MRDLWLVAWTALGVGFTFRYPFVGVLLWEWFSLMSPHRDAFGFSQQLPLNLIIALVTTISWIISKEPKHIPRHSILILLALFTVWMTFNSFFAFNPGWSWPYWDRTWRIIILGFIISGMATNRTRIEAILGVACVSLMYYGIKGGLFTIATGGRYKVWGPESTIIGDNNQLALALLVTLPLAGYLRLRVSSKPLSVLLGISIVLTAISIIGSYSRGAYIAMAAMAMIALFKVRRKFVYISMIAVAGAAIYLLVPQEIVDRAATIQSANADESFQERWMAWQVAFRYASDHVPFGAGFYGPQLAGIFNQYFPGKFPHAAHSIYFQVLGEHGYVGLAIYLILIFVSFRTCWKLSRTPQQEETQWIRTMAGMIQISLFAFLVGGAALSMAYYDLFIILICLLPQLALLSRPAPVKKISFKAETRVAAELQLNRGVT